MSTCTGIQKIYVSRHVHVHVSCMHQCMSVCDVPCDDVHSMYACICMSCCAHVLSSSHDEFVWARLVVITRIFGLLVNGAKTDGLVPMADMLNHKRPRETSWTYDDSRGGFTITTLRALNRGEQIYDSYG